MKIVVCVKQVPSATDAKIDPETKRIIREGSKSVLNPLDLYALEEAIRIKESFGGQVIALSMGPESAKMTLIEALSMGADQAVLLSDRAFGGSDTWATSYALAKAIEKIGNVDLILCGKQAIDGDTAQVGPGIASQLGIMQSADVVKVEVTDEKTLLVQRLHERGYDELELRLPALLTVLKDINVPHVPTLHLARIARRADIPVWKPEDIGADPEKIGLAASPTRVVRTDPPQARTSGGLKIDTDPKNAASELIKELKSRDLLEGGQS
ncbi:MAG: electron transfer flavoprotein subunit beta/FixA family protein [Clostridia bacterium]|nr:electron transfer flavoprotein subunit beta/FixA family protein [Clostridia bacterium]